MSRDPETIQREIEQTRAELAETLDTLAGRTNPKRLVGQGRQRALDAARSPVGIAVLTGLAALTTLAVVGRIRRARRR